MFLLGFVNGASRACLCVFVFCFLCKGHSIERFKKVRKGSDPFLSIFRVFKERGGVVGYGRFNGEMAGFARVRVWFGSASGEGMVERA